jgi:hypothetical protein
MDVPVANGKHSRQKIWEQISFPAFTGTLPPNLTQAQLRRFYPDCLDGRISRPFIAASWMARNSWDAVGDIVPQERYLKVLERRILCDKERMGDSFLEIGLEAGRLPIFQAGLGTWRD